MKKELTGKSIEQGSGEGKCNRVLKLGLDMHYRQVTVAMEEEAGAIKAVGRMGHDGFEHWVERKREAGWEIYSCYEAGASGYWLHRDLEQMGVKNLVVAPKAMGQDKGKKTDRRDSAELVDQLDRYLRGNRKALSAVALEYELKGLARFKTARALSSYTGLCPGIHSSDGRGKEGSINCCGNAAVRWNLVEMVWRLLKWQPDYQVVRQLGTSLVRSKRARKRLVVKAARQLAIDLWRLETGRITAQELGLVMQPTSKAK